MVSVNKSRWPENTIVLIRTESPLLFQDEISIILIRWLSVMLKTFIHHFIGHVTRTPTAKTYKEEMLVPISLPKLWKFLLKLSGTSAF